MKRYIKPVMAALMGIFATTSWADSEFNFSGFGTLGAVRTNTDAAEYRSGLRQHKGATSEPDLGVDSRLGLQVSYKLNEQFSAVGQVLTSRRDGKEGAQVEWLYGQFSPIKSVDLRAGRLVLPIFMLSDNRNVGYAHYWMRAPQEVYGVYPLTSFDGLQARWRDNVGGVNLNVQASGGTSDANLYLTAPDLSNNLFDARVTLKYKQLYSLAVNAEKGFWTVRASKTYGKKTEMLMPLPPFGTFTWLPEGTDNFTNFGLQYDDGSLVVMSEFVARRYSNQGLVNSNSYYLSGGYRFGSLMPYATYSHFSPKGAYYRRLTTSPGITQAVGVRWDVATNVAVKAQFERVRRTDVSFTQATMDFWSKTPSVNAVSLAVDFVF